jgi:hypothetical protein
MTPIKEDDLRKYRVRGLTILQLMTLLIIAGIAGDFLLHLIF